MPYSHFARRPLGIVLSLAMSALIPAWANAQALEPSPSPTTPTAPGQVAPPDLTVPSASVAGPTAAEPDPTAAPAPAATPAPTAAPAAVAVPAAEAAAPATPPPAEAKKDTPWYERIKIRGYTQMRYNRIPGKNYDDLKNSQGDRFLGKDNGFGIRRARVIIYGDVHEHVSIYLQPDFASTISGDPLNVAILRDWYTDIFFDKAKTFRLRAGQSKVPYGFENMQSSQNRLPFDRNDALNSAVKDERDIGLFLYWAPKHIRERFKYLVDSGLKGSGDYGVLALGAYNGQTANKPALSDDMHFVGRLAWPFKFGEQFFELGGGGYFGKYHVNVGDAKDYAYDADGIDDARAFATIVLYPQPFGFQAEGTYGTGPSLGWNETKAIEARELFGGYAQVMYKVDNMLGTVAFIPFVRAAYYNGGKKFDTLAPAHEVREIELGIEWQIWKALEVTFAYDFAHRKVQAKDLSDVKGSVGRLQLQFNY